MQDTQSLDEILTVMVASHGDISDLLFIPGKPPQVEMYGVLQTPALEWPTPPQDAALIEQLAAVIMENNPKLLQDLKERGSCDCSYSFRDRCRFRVNIYRQHRKLAMVLRLLKPLVPSFAAAGLPPVFHELIKDKNGITFVTGAAGNGKTTTLAALLNEINQTSNIHIVTLEDPVEFLHEPTKAAISQRELGHDFFTFSEGLRSALRQSPKVILVGEIRDRETMEIALNASETGIMIYTTLHTISAGQTINRILGMFRKDEEKQIRERLAGCLRYVIGQRLVPKKAGGRLLITEVMGQNLRTQEAIMLGENETRRLPDIIEAGNHAGWHSFEQSLLQACKQDLIAEETAMLYATNKPAMRQMLDASRGISGFTRAKMQASQMIVVPPNPVTAEAASPIGSRI
jgi:twitching motility protein PilT